jgi:hypothetical protein
MMQEKNPDHRSSGGRGRRCFSPYHRRVSLKTIHGSIKGLNPQELPPFTRASARERRVRATLPARCLARRYDLPLPLATLVAELALGTRRDG